jgi:hypothetical protein
MKWRAWQTRPNREKAPVEGDRTPGRGTPEGGNRLQRAARRLRLSMSGARDDLGHAKHRRRWLSWELAD